MESWGYESRHQLPGQGFGLLSSEAWAMGGGMLAQAGSNLVIGLAQAHSMQATAQTQANALITSAMQQANVAINDSNNRLEAAQERNDVMRLQTEQSSLVAKFQIMASLAERLDKNSSTLQIANINARLAERQEGNRHDEAMEQLRLREVELEQGNRETVDTSDFLTS